jgi:predicted amidohydrolase YtcJ
MHHPFLSLYQNPLPPNPPLIRLRINSLQTTAPSLTARLQNTYPFFGNAMVRTGGIGEFPVSLEHYAGGPEFDAAAGEIARAGWRLEVHSLDGEDFKGQIEGFERVDVATAPEGIKGLRWVVAHAQRISGEYLGRLRRLGGGVNVSGWMYLVGRTGNGSELEGAGPPFRRIVESGIRVGFGADGANIAPLSPWPLVYYAVTGRNSKGEVVNEGQTLERRKVLEMYTRDNTRFLGGVDETLLGVLEVGRLGDVAVLSDDYFEVSEEKLERMKSVLTVVGGVVVHDSGDL